MSEDGTQQDVGLEKDQTPKLDLVKQTFELLSNNTFREPTIEEGVALRELGYDITFRTLPISLPDVISRNKSKRQFFDDQFDYVYKRPELRDYIPPALVVVLRYGNLFLKGSENKPFNVQLKMIEAENQHLQKVLPEARAIILPPSVYAQADIALINRSEFHDKSLFNDRYVTTLVQPSLTQTSGHSAIVGRDDTSRPLRVVDWESYHKDYNVGAAPGVVFIQK